MQVWLEPDRQKQLVQFTKHGKITLCDRLARAFTVNGPSNFTRDEIPIRTLCLAFNAVLKAHGYAYRRDMGLLRERLLQRHFETRLAALNHAVVCAVNVLANNGGTSQVAHIPTAVKFCFMNAFGPLKGLEFYRRCVVDERPLWGDMIKQCARNARRRSEQRQRRQMERRRKLKMWVESRAPLEEDEDSTTSGGEEYYSEDELSSSSSSSGEGEEEEVVYTGRVRGGGVGGVGGKRYVPRQLPLPSLPPLPLPLDL